MLSNMISRRMIVAGLIVAASLSGGAYAETNMAAAKPVTVILVHGAFAGSSRWNDVIGDLPAEGYSVIVAPRMS